MSPNPVAEIQPEKGPGSSEMSGKETEQVSSEDRGTSKGARGLLKVPSRSSSQQRNQSSATSTGLSGATVTDHRNSISGRSKESKGSFAGRQRNGSASSNRTGGESEQGNTLGNSGPSSPSTSEQKKRKKRAGGLLSFLGCCGVPDAANTVDEGDNENVHKVEKLPQRPATAKTRPQGAQDHQPAKQPDDKELHQTVAAVENEDTQASGSGQNQATGAERQNDELKQPVPPAVTVDPPKSESQENEPREDDKSDDGDEDVGMQDAPPGDSRPPPEDSRDAPVAAEAQEPEQRTIPPPPPGPGPAVVTPLPLTDPGSAAQETQKWLLPPIASEHRGRKCLVLDLDETLVHSSFKVRLNCPQRLDRS